MSNKNSKIEKGTSQSSVSIYTIETEIGKGSFATVYKCINKKTNAPVAIKSVIRSKLKSKKLIENLEIEVSILKTMKHPHIVGLLDYYQTSTHFHLVMDYCSMGDLSYFIRKRNALTRTHPVIMSLLERYPSPEGSQGLNEVLVIHFLKQLASALEFLRSKSLVHRDIKPQNLLLCPPLHSKEEFINSGYVGLWELPVLKIADFGFARFLPSTSMAETLCGSPLYMAPEILRYEKYNAKADLWSVGAVLYEMTVGRPPFRADNHVQLLKTIERSNDKIKFPSAAQVPEPLKKLIRSLLKYNPTERISFNEFFNDSLITETLEGNDIPLETSEMDENLFISEYISPAKTHLAPLNEASDMNGTTNMSKISINDKKDSDLESESKGRGNSESIPIPSKSSRRDSEIRKIITKNSPGPETLSNSLSARKLKNTDSSPRNAENDIIFEKDYVVVEKRAVEVNAIADELAHAGSGAVAIKTRRGSSNDSRHGNNSPIINGQVYSKGPMRSESIGSQRRLSLTDRRISISISPTNALSKAIGLASNRLFGVNNFQYSTPVVTERNPDSHIKSIKDTNGNLISSEIFSNNEVFQKLNSTNTHSVKSGEAGSQENLSKQNLTMYKLESLAIKAHAINLFADVKFSQLIPSPPSCNESDNELFLKNDMLPPKMVKVVGEEGVALYIKALSLLAKGMSIASDWWYTNNDFESQNAVRDLRISNQIGSNSESKEEICSLGKSSSSRVDSSTRINELVQWIRDKFNEDLEKANFIKLRLQEAYRTLKKDCAETSSLEEYESSETRVIAEKLIFDRALEMSRTAAINELVKEDLKGCELAYSTAIWMLEALLEDDKSADNEIAVLDENDKLMIEKFVVSIGNRLSVLKRKLERN